ncbi:hypothetical protein RBG61_12365 [Paludicola sp. MB14-C6]|uniref:hypothetical protein n=1 Tax=Paludihabitans sp. MB14-C6 TaxID=3070656 RepID=UPI0027DC0F49|nr:hypothetical protein [Paludicola sp. MB14-C6]WMJ22774.1 hypothetical protein RBG61_12365 [Paludicola sp. MB14-C6]
MKRKLFVIVLCILLSGCLIGCSNGRKIMKEVPKKILLTAGGGIPSYTEDFRSLEVLVKHSDIIFQGTVKNETYLYWNEKYQDLTNEITFDNITVYYGYPFTSFRVEYAAGYAPISEYEKMVAHDGYLDKFRKQFTKEQRKNSYVKTKCSEENYMLPGDTFILFLSREKDGTYFPIGAAPGAMKIDGEYASQTINGHEHKVKDVIDYISKIDKNNKPICYSCEYRRQHEEIK